MHPCGAVTIKRLWARLANYPDATFLAFCLVVACFIGVGLYLFP